MCIRDRCIIFDLCNLTKEEVSVTKTKLDISEIDSITLRPYSKSRFNIDYDKIEIPNFDSTKTKRFNDEQIKLFVNKWNDGAVLGYDKLDKSNYYYLVTVYTKNGIRKFRTLQRFVTEDGKWAFSFKTDDLFETVWPIEKKN